MATAIRKAISTYSNYCHRRAAEQGALLHAIYTLCGMVTAPKK